MLIGVLAIISESGFVNTIWPADCLTLSLSRVCERARGRPGPAANFYYIYTGEPRNARLVFCARRVYTAVEIFIRR